MLDITNAFLPDGFAQTSSPLDLKPLQRRRRRKQKADDINCLVCGELVVHKHFGERTCNSCAAFFRRTVSQRRSYFCRQNEACHVSEKRHKNRCAYCRFHRCIEIGMDMRKVLSGTLGGKVNYEAMGILWNLQRNVHGNFIHRRRIAIQKFGAYRNMWEEKRNAQTFVKATEIEANVLRDFFRELGIIECEQFGTDFETHLCTEMMSLWMLLEIIFNTRAHSGHRTRKLYYVDDSYLEYSEDALCEFYRSHDDVFNPSSLARMCMSLYEKYMKTTNLIHRMAIDDSERMALTLICVCRLAFRKIGESSRMRELLNKTFRELKSYYDGTYNNVATRFGQLMLCTEAIEEAHSSIIQQLTVVQLNYKNSAGYGYNTYSMTLSKE